MAVDQYLTIHQDPCFGSLQVEAPDARSACLDEQVVFEVTASGTGPFSFQWRKDGVPIPDADGRALTLTVDAGSPGEYDCVVANPTCDVTTPAAVLTLATPAVVSAQPTDLVVFEGQAALFAVFAGGAPSYQWHRDDVPIAAGTGNILTIPSVTLADIGSYSCGLDSGCIQPTFSNTAMLCVVARQLWSDTETWPDNDLFSLLTHVQNACPPDIE